MVIFDHEVFGIPEALSASLLVIFSCSKVEMDNEMRILNPIFMDEEVRPIMFGREGVARILSW